MDGPRLGFRLSLSSSCPALGLLNISKDLLLVNFVFLVICLKFYRNCMFVIIRNESMVSETASWFSVVRVLLSMCARMRLETLYSALK